MAAKVGYVSLKQLVKVSAAMSSSVMQRALPTGGWWLHAYPVHSHTPHIHSPVSIWMVHWQSQSGMDGVHSSLNTANAYCSCCNMHLLKINLQANASTRTLQELLACVHDLLVDRSTANIRETFEGVTEGTTKHDSTGDFLFRKST